MHIKSTLQEDLERIMALSPRPCPRPPAITLERLVELHAQLVAASRALHTFTERVSVADFRVFPPVKTPVELVQEDVDAYLLQQAVDHAEKAYAEGIADFAALQ